MAALRPFDGKPRADRAIQRGLERHIAAVREGFELFRDIGIECHGRAYWRHGGIIAAENML